ncbi:MAG: NAD(P)-dependent oxidoreductase [Coriobacteriia bacterium]
MKRFLPLKSRRLPLSSEPLRIGFVGTGVMGLPMADHLLDAGYELVVYNRTREKAAELLERGASWRDSAGEVAAVSDVIITMVGYPADVEECYLAAGGIIEKARLGTLAIDMTTSSPSLARRIASAAQAAGIEALDAPVSGGDVGARNATLTIMVGGSESAFEAALPILSVMGKSVKLQGGPGAGQHAKMANQIAIAGSMFAMVEMLSYAAAVGLDPASVLESVKAGSAGSWALENLAPRILARDFTPGFFVKHFVKDLRIAVESAEEAGIELPALKLAKSLYELLERSGGANLGTQALWLLYASDEERRRAGVDSDARA